MSSDDPIAKQLEIRYDVERRLDVDALEKKCNSPESAKLDAVPLSKRRQASSDK